MNVSENWGKNIFNIDFAKATDTRNHFRNVQQENTSKREMLHILLRAMLQRVRGTLESSVGAPDNVSK